MYKFTIILLLLVVFSIQIHNNRRIILLQNDNIDTTTTTPIFPTFKYGSLASWAASSLTSIFSFSTENNDEEIHSYLFHYDPKYDIRKDLLKLGIKLGDYIPHNTLIGTATRKQAKKANSIKGILWIGDYKDSYKTHSKNFNMKLLSTLNQKDIKKGGRRLHESPENSIQIVVTVANFENETDLKKLAEELKQQLQQTFKSSFINLIITSENGLAFSVTDSDTALSAMKLLSKNAYVHWIEIKPTTKTYNKYASKLIQSYTAPQSMPITNRGLNGEGEIIGIGDTGLDYYHCMFFDPENKVPIVRTASEAIPDAKHRKLKSYFAFMDDIDSRNGHGTHVASIASGYVPPNLNAPSAIRDFNSLAFNSKLAMMDLGCDKPEGCTCPTDVPCECLLKPQQICPQKISSVYLPVDLDAYYFPWFYKQGVRVMSNSWGTGYYKDFNFGYSKASAQIDKFVWNHKDFLPIFAAGNSGGQFGYTSLTSEAQSKNSLVVGASQSTLQGIQDAIKYLDFHNVADKIRNELFRTYCNKKSYDYDEKLCNETLEFDVSSCCDDTVDGVKMCGGPSKFTPQCCGNQKFPEFKMTIGRRCCPDCIRLEMATTPSHFQSENLALFTARGPTLDHRVKPDVVSVGDIVTAAKSTGTTELDICNVDQKFEDIMVSRRGTSMAAPLVAGAALIVRQFYRQGFYPSGKKNPADGFTPSAALIKATLIHSAKELSGYIYVSSKKDWIQLQYGAGDKFALKPPLFQGFGRVELENVLGTTSHLILPNGKVDREISTGEVHVFCYHLKDSWRLKKNPLKVTLVWTDPPSSPQSKLNLVNDLDLKAITPDGQLFYGNGFKSPYRTSRTEADYQNNVEQLVFNTFENSTGAYVDIPGKYTIVVQGTNIPLGPQSYALVISGDVEPVPDLKGCPMMDFKMSMMHYQQYKIYKIVTYILSGVAAFAMSFLCVLLCIVYGKYKTTHDELVKEGHLEIHDQDSKYVPLASVDAEQ